jgi:hypothetical protein
VKRELRVADTDKVLGSISSSAGKVSFDGAAADVFARLRTDLGDSKAASQLLADGWSNGKLYLADQT